MKTIREKNKSKSIRVLWVWFILHHYLAHRRTTAILQQTLLPKTMMWWCLWRRRWWWRWLWWWLWWWTAYFMRSKHILNRWTLILLGQYKTVAIFSGWAPLSKWQNTVSDKWKHCTYPVAVYWMLGVFGTLLAITVIWRAHLTVYIPPSYNRQNAWTLQQPVHCVESEREDFMKSKPRLIQCYSGQSHIFQSLTRAICL